MNFLTTGGQLSLQNLVTQIKSGNEPIGWMAKPKELDNAIINSYPIKKSIANMPPKDNTLIILSISFAVLVILVTVYYASMNKK